MAPLHNYHHQIIASLMASQPIRIINQPVIAAPVDIVVFFEMLTWLDEQQDHSDNFKVEFNNSCPNVLISKGWYGGALLPQLCLPDLHCFRDIARNYQKCQHFPSIYQQSVFLSVITQRTPTKSLLAPHPCDFSPQNIKSEPHNPLYARGVIQFILFLSKNPNMSSSTVRKSIKHYTYNLAHTIGQGFSSQVYAGLDEKISCPVAVKVVSKLGQKSSEQMELAQAQIRALGVLKGRDNILELREALQTRSAVYIVTELCSGGTLRDLLARQRRLPEGTATRLMRQLIRGYWNIHQQRLVHRDIKPDNIFLTSDGDVRIGDFGFAISVQECADPVRENLGSPLFMSLEALGKSMYGYKSDIWAIGVTFFEMLMGRVPWRSKTEKELLVQIQKFDVEPLLPKGMSASCKTFLKRTLENDVEERMSPEELFAFQFQKQKELKPSMSINLIKHTSLERIRLKSPVRDVEPKVKRACSPHCKKQSESTQEEHSKPQLSELQEEAENRIVEQMTTSLPIPPPTASSSKLSRKYSQPDPEEPIQSLTQLRRSVNGRMVKDAVVVVQSQINYFRFVFKLFKRIHDTLRTTDEHIGKLKQNLLFLVHAKINEIRAFQYLPVEADMRQVLKSTAEYARIVEVLGQYEQRYARDEAKAGVRGACSDEEELVGQLCFTLKVLSQNILRVQTCQEEFQRKKGLVLIVQDLVSLSQMYLIERTHDWTAFHQQSGIQKALERPPSISNPRAHWQVLKEQVKKFVDI